MNLNETLALLEALKASGVKHFKSHEHDITLGGPSGPIDIPIKREEKPLSESKNNPAFNPEATQKAEALIDLLKSSDEKLLDKIFPAGS